MVSDEILRVVRCPASREALVPTGGRLTAAESARTYAVVDGIPILVDDAEVAGRPAEDAIVAAFRTRSSSYLADNYRGAGNPERIERRRRVERIVDDLVAPGMKVLDAGAGPAVFAEAVGERGALYIALDLSLENLLEARRRLPGLHGVVGSLAALPIEEGAFDAVLAIGCLEYLDDPAAALGGLARAIRPGGLLVATFANRRSPRRWWDEALVGRLWRAKQAALGQRATLYRRRLLSVSEVRTLLARANLEIRAVEFLGPGLLGYPLSASRRLAAVQERLARRVPRLKRLGSELLLVARREDIAS